MALIPGSRLGVYEITAAIGEGGMGQVFRARDTRLDRDVAIKILPEAFAHDADRLKRFTREARTLASLNHPNIAAIYGLEESGALTALVMELVEGEDLSQRIARGAIPLDEALPIAKQIAAALEAAHEQGIIHRDLKPANIKVRADGTVKVLDFGLAKAIERPGESGGSGRPRGTAGVNRLDSPDPLDVSASPTMTSPAMLTGAGVILGTAAYMAPEQAKGKPLDRRADMWAFGASLYEMLTAQRAFKGEDSTDTIAAVVSREPDWSALPASTPASIRRVLRRCLEKDRRQRLDSAAGARLEVDEALTAPASVDSPGLRASDTRRPRAFAWVGSLTVAAVVIVALAVPAGRYLTEAPPPEMRTDIVTPGTADPMSFALSPDGRQIVFVASGDGALRLWLRSLATTTAQPLPGTEGAASPFWSPDSRSVGFFADGMLKRLDVGGGPPQTIAEFALARGGTWNADGVILFTANLTTPIYRAPASGGAPAAVTTLDRQSSHRFPSFLPDGRHFLFYAQGTPDTAGIYVGALDEPVTRRLTAADAAGVYLPDVPGRAGAFRGGGWLLWVRGGTLVARRLDVDRLTLTGEQVPLASPVMADPTFSGAAALSASAGGLLAYRTGGSSRRQLAFFDRSGTALGTLGAPDENGLLQPSVSPDGRWVVVSRTVRANADLWLLDGSRTTRFTFDLAPEGNPVWSPDGRDIAFDSTRSGPRDLYHGSSSNAGGEDVLLQSPQAKLATDWSPDGRFVLFNSPDPKTDWDLWALPLADRTPRVILKTPFREMYGAFSPDGRWIAYMSNESGRNEIYVRPFAAAAASGAELRPRPGQAADAAGGQWQISTAGGIFPRWRHDGKELYYLAPSGAMMAAPIGVTGSTLAPGSPVTLFPTQIVGSGADAQLGRQYDVTRDGRFLINTVLDSAAAPITLIQNWSPKTKP